MGIIISHGCCCSNSDACGSIKKKQQKNDQNHNNEAEAKTNDFPLPVRAHRYRGDICTRGVEECNIRGGGGGGGAQ